MKKILSAFVCALMMCALSVCAFAEGDRLYDDAGLLSESEAAQVSALLDDVSAEHGANVVIVTTNEALGDPEADARATYESICSGDGVIFLLSMNGREWAIWATEGYAREALHEDAREKVFDDIRGYLTPQKLAAGSPGRLCGLCRGLRRNAHACRQRHSLQEAHEPVEHSHSARDRSCGGSYRHRHDESAASHSRRSAPC